MLSYPAAARCATSARCRSAACSTFFERDVVSVEKTPERAAAGFDPSLAQFCNRFYQGQVLAVGRSDPKSRPRTLPPGETPPRLRGGAPLLIPALQPLYRRRHADLETLCCLASRRTGLHSCDKALPANVGKQRHLQKPLFSTYLVATANCGKLPRMPRCLVHVWS